MYRVLGAIAACLLAVSGLACASGSTATSPPAPSPGPEDPTVDQDRVRGEYIVKLAPGADPAAVRDVFGRFGVQRVQSLGGALYLVTLSGDPGPRALEEARQGDARIASVQPNYRYRGTGQ